MVTAGMTPRDAVRQLEARLTAAGCPDADSTPQTFSGW